MGEDSSLSSLILAVLKGVFNLYVYTLAGVLLAKMKVISKTANQSLASVLVSIPPFSSAHSLCLLSRWELSVCGGVDTYRCCC